MLFKPGKVGIIAPIEVVMLPEALAFVRWQGSI